MNDSRSYANRRFLGFVCLLAIVTSVLALLGWPPTKRLAGAEGVRAMWAGVAVSWIASVVGGLPIWRAIANGRPLELTELMGGMGLRFVVVLFGALYLVLNGLVPTVPLIVWIGLSYLLLLPFDVRFAVRSNANREASD